MRTTPRAASGSTRQAPARSSLRIADGRARDECFAHGNRAAVAGGDHAIQADQPGRGVASALIASAFLQRLRPARAPS